MTFFVVTAAIMAVSILLIYKLCRFFGLELKWISLVLCAMMAFGVNGATIILSPFLDQGHYFKLIALVLVAAGLVTLINEYLLKREHRQLAAAGGAVLTLETEEEEEAEEMLQAASESEAKTEAGEKLSQRLQEAVKANSTTAEPAEEAAAEAPTEEGQPEAAEAPADTAETEIETAAEEPDEEVPETTVTEAEQPEEAAEEPAPADAGEMAEAAETVETIDTAETVEDTADAGTAEADASAEKAENQETENKAEGEPVPEEDSSAAEIPATDEESPEEQPPAPAEEPAPQEESPEQPAEAAPAPQESRTISLEPEAAEAAVAELSTLDEILDFAYANKEKDVDAAITAYRAAIDRYPEDSYTPFLIIELAGMYKERASYSEAINLYAESLGMPIIAGDDAMVQEFSKTLRYLGTVQDILKKHHALATPFSKLTPDILDEIEDEFAKRQAK
ncbi:MAG: hypothetical protein IJU00_15725 [Selenomonas sp.]|nr:hypothetical protein [Selenomonas sp.]